MGFVLRWGCGGDCGFGCVTPGVYIKRYPNHFTMHRSSSLKYAISRRLTIAKVMSTKFSLRVEPSVVIV